MGIKHFFIWFKNHFPDAFIVVVLAGKKEQTLTFHPDKYFYSVSSFLSLEGVFQFIVKQYFLD